jgi:hypothetical protein
MSVTSAALRSSKRIRWLRLIAPYGLEGGEADEAEKAIEQGRFGRQGQRV